MDCRKLWLGGLMIAGLVGCSRREVVRPDAFTPTIPSHHSAQPHTVAASRRSARDLSPAEAIGKPENLAKIGDVHSVVALDTTRPPDQRQQAYTLATQNYRRALQLDARHTPASLGLARLCSGWGEHDQAVMVLNEAITRAPNDAAARYELGMVLGRMKRFDEALNFLYQASQLDPNNVRYTKSVGLMYARLGHAEEADAWLSRVMTPADARYNVGRMMVHIDLPDEASRQFQLALQADPRHAATLVALGAAPDPASDSGASPADSDPSLQLANLNGMPRPAQPLKITYDSPAPAVSLPERPAAEPEAKRGGVKIGFEPGN